ncbi:MAG: DUF507 family protein [Nitrospirae bacterium]|nr:DUF507 family protein [Nitrospirota bacterium]
MKLKKERIAILAKNIVEGLSKGGFISVGIREEELINRMVNTITEEMMIEDRLNEEVREILKKHSKELEQGSVNYQKMFQMVKNKLVREKGVIL